MFRAVSEVRGVLEVVSQLKLAIDPKKKVWNFTDYDGGRGGGCL